MKIHVLPGRIRLRPETTLDLGDREFLGDQLRTIIPSAMLEHSAASGSILIRFEEKELTDTVLALLKSKKIPVSYRKKPSSPAVWRWPSQTVVKRAMAGSLLASLLLATLDREKAHVFTGSVFLAFLSRHLFVYRRRLLK